MPPRTLRILLVEDNPGDVELVHAALADRLMPVELQLARDGSEALELLRSGRGFGDGAGPDLVLLDLNLPGLGGRELLKAIKDDPRTATIPVVVMTSSAADEEVRRSYALHANCYVRKPLDLDAFVRVIRSLIDFWALVATLPERAPKPAQDR